MRPIFSLFEKIKREKIARKKERVLLCALNFHAVVFCYIAQRNNFQIDAVMPLYVKENDLTDYSSVPSVQEIPETEKQNYLVVLILEMPQQHQEQIVSIMKQNGYDSIILLDEDDRQAVMLDLTTHNYLTEKLNGLLIKANWNKQIFLLGLNQFTPTIVNILKIKGYVISGIISDEVSSQVQNLHYEDIPFFSVKEAMNQKNAFLIDCFPTYAEDDIFAPLRNKFPCWNLSLSELQVALSCWNFIRTFYNLLDLKTPSKNLNYEKKSLEILSVYERVTICFMDTQRIASMLETLALVNQRKDKKNLYVLVPIYHHLKSPSIATEKTANNFLLKKIEEVCPIIANDRTKDFWRYFIQHHANVVNCTNDFCHYAIMMEQIERFHNDDLYVKDPPIVFSEEEELLGQQKMAAMGIIDKYVTFFARGNNYIKIIFDEDANGYVDEARNCPVQNFSLMCQKLYENGFQTVRMGHLVDDEISGDGIIDYANKYREEFLDFYLIAKSKLFVGGQSALSIIASLFHVPLVMANCNSLTVYGDISFHRSNRTYTIILPKKLFDPHKQRFLSLKEQLALELKVPHIDRRMEYFQSQGFKYIDNTPEEIWDAVEEMLLRLEGKFKPTEVVQKLQEEYDKALSEALEHNPKLIPFGRIISSKFLLQSAGLI